MTRMIPFAIATTLALAGVSAFAGSDGSCCADVETQQENVTGQILIRFDDALSETDAAQIVARVGAQEIDRMMDGKIYLIEIPYPSSQSDIITALSATKGVIYAEPNQTVRIPELPQESDAVDDGQSELIPLPKVD